MDKIPSRYTKYLYNIYPLLLSFGTTKIKSKLDELYAVHSSYMNTNYHSAVLPGSGLDGIYPLDLITNFEDRYGKLLPNYDVKILKTMYLFKSNGKPGNRYDTATNIFNIYGNKKVKRKYLDVLNTRFRRIWNVANFVLEVDNPSLASTIKKYSLDDLVNKNIIAPSTIDDFKDYSIVMKSYIDTYQNLIKFMDKICNLSERRDLKIIIKYEQDTLTDTFSRLIKNVGNIANDIILHRSIIVEKLSEPFEEYFAPRKRSENKSITFKMYSTPDTFFKALRKMESKKVLHHKINARTKKDEELRSRPKIVSIQNYFKSNKEN